MVYGLCETSNILNENMNRETHLTYNNFNP